MYEVIRDDDATILYRVAKNGRVSECMRVMNTKDGRLLIIDKNKKDSYMFRDDKVTLKKVGSQYVAKIDGSIRVFVKPHYVDYHNVIISESNNRYSLVNARYKQSIGVDNMMIDDRAILDNMLEFIAEL